MKVKKMFRTIQEIQQIQYFATLSPETVGLQNSDGSVSVDAKSFINIFSLNFAQPIVIISEDADFFKKIEGLGVTLHD